MSEHGQDRRARITAALLTWYDQNRRDLPWREDPRPYEVWVSEIMAQQTRMDVVIPYFHRFLERFPTLGDLAAASVDDVLPLWAGLGYYSRAHHLHTAARRVVENHGGQIPDDLSGLLALPGIGPYTAGAILSIAFGQPVAAIDGNVKRVFARLENCREEQASVSFRNDVQVFVEALIPADRPGAFTQAMMELGALVCVPRVPRCGACPLQSDCLGFGSGQPETLPRRAPKAKPRKQAMTVLLVEDDRGRLLLHQRQQRLLQGMWVYHLVEGRLDRQAIDRELCRLGLTVRSVRSAGTARHVFSHLIWEMEGHYVRVASGRAPQEGVWVERPAWRSLALPAAVGGFTRWLDKEQNICGLAGDGSV